MKRMQRILYSAVLVLSAAATTLPFQDNLDNLSPTCVAARPDGDQNNKGCCEFKVIGLDRYGYPTMSLVNGAFQCTYRKIEDEADA